MESNFDPDYVEVSSSDSDSDSDSDSNSRCKENTDPKKELIVYFTPDHLKKQLVFEGNIYNHIRKNRDGSSRWTCSNCRGAALKTDGNLIQSRPETAHLKSCTIMDKAETICKIQYETLKFNARQTKFNFNKEYDSATEKLRKTLNEVDVALHWPALLTAKSTIGSIRKKYVSDKSTRVAKAKSLQLSDDMKTITVDNKEQIFLQYDNDCKKGNRILIFYSERATEILKMSIFLGCDGTFKYSPKIFYQIFTIISEYKNDSYPCVFMLLQKKEYETYLEAIVELRRNLFQSYGIAFGPKLTIILDFELAMQQALRQAFLNEVTIKGCWFHFCQAILKHVGKLGLKESYNSNFYLKFWIKRFMALALIPIDQIESAVKIIINELDQEQDMYPKQIEFLQYFVEQWLNAKQSKQGPAIWNQYQATIRTNNVSEVNHSIQSSSIPRHHPLCSQIITYFKESDAKSSDKFMKSHLNLTSSQSKSTRTQKDFDENLATTQEENNLLKFEEYYDKISYLIVGRYANYPDTQSETESDSDCEELVQRDRKDKLTDTFKNPINTFENVDFLGNLKKERKRKIVFEKKDTKQSKKSKKTSKSNEVLSRQIIPCSIDESMDCVYWLNDLNIDIALESMQLQYPHVTILTLGNQAHAQIGTNGFKQDFENTSNLIMVLWYKSHWVTVTNIDTGRSTLPISTENVPIFVYDSFDNATYLNGLQLTLNTMFPTKGEYIIHKAKIWYPQVGANDCGLFALAYVKALCLNLEPSLVTFCQSTMVF